MPKSNAQYKADQRARDEQKGLVRKEIKIYPDLWPTVKRYIERLMRGKDG